MKINFKKMNGLVPAVIQDINTLQVLMVGFMNEESYLKTIETKKVWFYSRTKKRLWMKGEESRNYLNLVKVIPDCDNDSLLLMVNPAGPTCHLAKESCFDSSMKNGIAALYQIIESRKKMMPKDSYTVSLFQEGVNKICAKIGEESGEVIKSALKETKARLLAEIIDLIFHLLVLAVSKNISFNQLKDEVQSRMKK